MNFFKRISHQDKLFFTKHLSIMLKSGITIVDALSILSEQTESLKLQDVLASMMTDMKNGQSLAKALDKYTDVFDPLYVNIIKVGETSGTLDSSLAFLTNQQEKDFRLKKKIQNALMYPAIVLVAATLIGGFISLFILPQLVEFFETLQVDLPITTQILLFVANTMKDYGIFIFGGIFLLFFGVERASKTSWGKPIAHSILINTPLIGKLMRYYILARFCRNLGTLIKSGIPILDALKTTKRTVDNIPYSITIEHLYKEVKKGHPLAQAMEGVPRDLYPRLITKMISVGEHTGELDKTLLYLSEFYEDEVDNIAQNLTPILEPILLLVIGAVVGFIALAIISPIYELTGSIR